MTQIIPGINLDLYAYCNAKCKFCSSHNMTRERGVMSDEIFHKVIDELSGTGGKYMIMPYFYGEPLLNAKLFTQCDYISEKLPDSSIEISTNGRYLTKDKIDALLKIKTLKYLGFSAYAGTKETYESLMGMTFDTLDLIDIAISRFKTERPDVRLCVGATSDPRFVTPNDCTDLIRRYPDTVSFHPISFTSQHKIPEYTRATLNTTSCPVPFSGCVVFWDGRVGLCCFDVNGDLVIGDVTKTSLTDAVNSELAMKYRDAIQHGLKDVISLCRTCTQPI